VVVAIARSTTPITLLTFKLGAAAITGNTVVAKPAADTPLSTLRMAELFADAATRPASSTSSREGRTSGRRSSPIPSPPRSASRLHRRGIRIHELAAATNKRVTLEMGGHCPAVLLEDADLDVAVPALVKHAYANSGQFCYRVNRIYAHASHYEALVERFAAGAAALRVGDGTDPETDLGPLVGERILRTSVEHVADARAQGGARGGRR
jgi:succinate-semialdehyde dehydrogenase/glutarate-semialdehyde dehydrogenase